MSKHRYKTIIFGLDGVITDTSDIHSESWKRVFDEFLLEYKNISGRRVESFVINLGLFPMKLLLLRTLQLDSVLVILINSVGFMVFRVVIELRI